MKRIVTFLLVGFVWYFHTMVLYGEETTATNESEPIVVEEEVSFTEEEFLEAQEEVSHTFTVQPISFENQEFIQQQVQSYPFDGLFRQIRYGVVVEKDGEEGEMLEWRDIPESEHQYSLLFIDQEGNMQEKEYTFLDQTVTFEVQSSGFYVLVEWERPMLMKAILRANNQQNYTSKVFSYTGKMQEFVVPSDGEYILEVWGGQGGSSGTSPMGHRVDGGKGGYSKGSIILKKGTKLFIGVGGQGATGRQDDQEALGGFNGGGNAKGWKSESEYGDGPGYVAMGAGGGATHIATASGLLRDLANQKQAVLIVAGGGGGGACYIWEHPGDNGGGLTGGGYGGSQDKPGKFQSSGGFGYGGGHQVYTGGKGPSTQDAGTGGGSGWYGGGGGYAYGNGGFAGGGGSGYIGGVTNGTTQNGVREGNGEVKISWIPQKTITVRYLDAKTKEEISPTVSKTLIDGETYSITSPTIPNYLLENDTQKTIQGTVSEDKQVDVFYVKQETPVKTVLKNGKSANQTFVKEGDSLKYVIQIKNPTKQEKTYKVTDVISKQLEVKEISDGGKRQDASIIWNLKLKANETKEISFQATVKGSGGISNQASLEVDHLKQTSNQTENWVVKKPIKTGINSKQESIHQKVVAVNDTVTYRIEVENPATIKKKMIVKDTLASGLEIIRVSDGGSIKENTVTFEKEMAPSEKATFEIKVKVTAEAQDKILMNTAVLTMDGIELPSNTVETGVMKPPVKKVKNKDGNEIDGELIAVDEILVYEIFVKNPMESEKEIIVKDLLPESFEVLSIEPEALQEDGVVIWKSVFQGKEEKKYVIEGKALKENVSLSNQALVQIDQNEIPSNQTNNDVPKKPTKKVLDENNRDIHQATIYAGEKHTLTYEIFVQNPSQETRQFEIEDTLDESVIFDTADEEGVFENGVVKWKLTLEQKEEKVVHCTVKLKDENVGKKILNQADVISGNYRVKTNTTSNYLDDNPEKISVQGKITWEDEKNKDQIRPSYVILRLYANGEEVQNQRIPIKEEETPFTFSRLNRFYQGKEITYSLVEDTPEGYSVLINQIQKDTYHVINKHKPVEKKKEETKTPQPTTSPIPSSKPTPTPSASPIVQTTTTQQTVSNPVSQTNEKVSVPKTGDSFSIGKYFLSLCLAMGYIVYALQKEKEE